MANSKGWWEAYPMEIMWWLTTRTVSTLGQYALCMVSFLAFPLSPGWSDRDISTKINQIFLGGPCSTLMKMAENTFLQETILLGEQLSPQLQLDGSTPKPVHTKKSSTRILCISTKVQWKRIFRILYGHEARFSIQKSRTWTVKESLNRRRNCILGKVEKKEQNTLLH